MTDRAKYQITRNLLRATGDLQYMLCVYGDKLAKEEGYKAHSGIDAIHFYLIQKYSWTPAVVRAMNYDDLHFLMAEKVKGWHLPEEAINE